MAFPVFAPSRNPDKGMEGDRTPRVISNTDFALGYPQSTPDGINTFGVTGTLNWSVLAQADSDYIVSFMRANYGSVFLYTMPGDIPRKFVCTNIKRSYMTDYASVQVGLQERFDLG